jgi:DNA-binding transcriptional LysR family regulator
LELAASPRAKPRPVQRKRLQQKPSGKLVEVLPGWSGRGEGGVYAILPPGRLVPTKTRLFVDEIANSIKVGWARKKRS